MSLRDEFEDLEEVMCGDEPDWDTDPEPPPLDMDDADRKLRWHARLRRQWIEAHDIAETERERIDLWEANRLVAVEARLEWLETWLAQFHRAAIHHDPKALTISLPGGTLKSRKAEPQYVYDDEVFVSWAAKYAPDLVRTPEPKSAPDKAAVRKTLTPGGGEPGDTVPVINPDTGETIPGVTAVIRDRTYTVETNP